MSELKLCKDCKHLVLTKAALFVSVPALCAHPSLLGIDPVSGDRVFKRGIYSSMPRNVRETGECGMDAKLFEAAPPPEPEGPTCLAETPSGQQKRVAGFWGLVNAIFTKKSTGAV